MNQDFEELSQCLHEKSDVSRDELIAALYLIRAHRSLAGIQSICKRLVTHIHQRPAIVSNILFLDLAARIAVLEKISVAEGLPSRFVISKPSSPAETPLIPYTGDSGLCDLYLMEPEDGDPEHKAEFETGIGWYAWQVIQNQALVHSTTEYEKYLHEGKIKLRESSHEGGRLYRAFVNLRMLADHNNKQALIDFNAYVGDPTEESSINLMVASALLRLNSNARIEPWLNLYSKKGVRPLPDTLHSEISRIALFLEVIWKKKLVSQSSREGANRTGVERRIIKPRVELWNGMATEITSVEQKAGFGGTAFDFYLNERDPSRKHKAEEDAELPNSENDPDQAQSAEPQIRLFLGTNDPISSFYASRSAAHYIELSNAMLPWQTSRLSLDAIRALLNLVGAIMNEDIYKCRARLAIGLSLISGRSIQEVSAVIITSMGIPKLSSTYPIGISLDDMVLHVLCARPNLKLPAELKEYCAPNSEVIRLPLPQSWRELVKVVENESGRRHPKVYENARQLLEELPDHLGISDKGIRSALGVELLARSGGDRGLLKVVTDSGGANLNNIIHYASYNQSQVEDMWRTVIEGWMEHPLPPLSQPLIPGARVGSPQGFLIEKVKQRIQIVKDLFDSAVKQKHWDAAFNHLMVYTVLWSNLATAGRKSKHPLPACVSDGWFYVNDKSRIDESTDRLVPYTESMLAQLKVTLSFVDCISILHPEVVFNHDTRARIRHLKMSQDGVFIPFQPKLVDQHPGLKDLPANWARKLVRSESGEMIARFRDAGLGHIVMGRHPWSLYSTFDSMAFQKAWTSMQHRLEDELGFELLTVDDLPVPVDVLRNPEPRSDKCAAKSKDEKAIMSVPEEELVALIEKHRHQGLEIYDQNGKASAEIIADAAKRIVMLWLKTDPDTAKAKAESLCSFIRTKYLVHLFVSKPRVRHRRAWLVSESEFWAFAQFELLIREPFQRDLEHLPDRTDVSADADPSMVELGRLLMIAIWRMGVLSIPQIEMLLTYLASEAPVLAIDDLRMIPLEVRCARTEELMKRTVFLEPYSAVYLTVERETLRAILRPILQEKPRQRTVRLQRALTAYLSFMNIESLLTLNEMVSAAKQSMMLKSAPVLAAYSAGQIYTVDLDDAELIRLSGRKGFKRKNTLLIQNNSIAGRDVHDDALSEMGQGLAKGFTSKLHGYRSPDPGEWIRRLSNTRAQSHIEVLLREFSIWLIGTMEAANASMKLDTRSRNSLSRNITIVGHALLHMAEGPKGGLFIDEVTLQQLQLQIEDHFKDRHLHAAWNALRRFLNEVKSGHYEQRNGSMIDESEPKLSDIKFGVIGEATEDQVSAKILSSSEIQAVRDSIKSVLSGIGNPLDSIAANRFLALLNATGMRRGEAVMLRSKDAMTDLCRLQPYGELTLKTQSSERNLPYDFFDDELKQIIEQARSQSRAKIADPTRDREARSAGCDRDQAVG